MTHTLVPTAELIGSALDWAVAHAAGVAVMLPSGNVYPNQVREFAHPRANYHPSTNWAQAGPIIEREGIVLVPFDGPVAAYLPSSYHQGDSDSSGHIDVDPYDADATGPTVLVAAMRCYVASKLGNVVDVPSQLLAPTTKAEG